MRIAVTGAAGFVGRSLARHMQDSGFSGEVLLVDRAFAGTEAFETLELDLTAPGSVAKVVERADCVVHLAALPGGAAEEDPAASRRINFDVGFELIRQLKGRRLIYASSIAVLGSDLREPVDDATPADPDSVYGTHKRMVELAFADAVTAGWLNGLALRLPAIVARPPSAKGFGSAFLSDAFHAAWHGRELSLPVGPDATMWLMSGGMCARNLAHAALSSAGDADALNLPALRVSAAQLVEGLATVGDTRGISFDEESGARRAFGSYPPLRVDRAEAMGFVSDDDLTSLIDSAGRDYDVKRPRMTETRA